jgi:hypothetical protein
MKPDWQNVTPLVHQLAESIDLGEQLALSAREDRTRSWAFEFGCITVSTVNNQRVHDRLEKGYLVDRAARLRRIEVERNESERLKRKLERESVSTVESASA